MDSLKQSLSCILVWGLIFKMKKSFKIFLFIACCCAFIGCDRVTKDIAKEHLKNKEPVSYLHNTVRLQYAENTGGAMNLGDDLPKTISLIVFSFLPLIFLFILFAYSLKHIKKFSAPKIFCLALIFSGGIGNIIDRVLHDRHVPDFMIVGIQNFRTGIFNVADVCVTAGVIGLLIFYKDKKLAVVNNS